MRFESKGSRIFTEIIAWIAVFAMAFLLFSCGSRKKNLEVTSLKEKSISHSDSLAFLKSKIETSAKLQEQAKTAERELEIEYEGCEGDSLTMTEIGADGKIVSQITIKGTGKGKFKSKNKTTDTKRSEASAEKKDVESGVSVKKNKEKSLQSKKKALEVEKTGLGFWFWFWLILIIILICLLLYLNKRFSVIKRVTDFVSQNSNLRKKY